MMLQSMAKFLRISIWAFVSVCSLYLSNALAAAPPECNVYPQNRFQVCYFSGTNPNTGAYLGLEQEASIAFPAPQQGTGFNRSWGFGAIYGTIYDQISAVWRGAPYFQAGRYHFHVFGDDGVRLYIDETLVVDEWRSQDDSFTAAVELTEGYHNIRLEWYEQDGGAKAALTWDRGQDFANARVSPIVIDTFVITQQNVCIAGNPWDGIGNPDETTMTLFNANGTVYKRWQRQDAQDLPRALLPSDPNLGQYAQVECLQLGMNAQQRTRAYEQIDRFKSDIQKWSFGKLAPTVNVREVSGEIGLTRWGGGWWTGPWDARSKVASYLTTDTDFTMVLPSLQDVVTGRYISPGGCGGTLGPDYGIAGAGYSWIPDTSGHWFQCLNDGTLMHEWGHQFDDVLTKIMGLNRIYFEDPVLHTWNYPSCGMGDPDLARWIPGSHEWNRDPDSYFCNGANLPAGAGDPGNRPVEAHRLLDHFDPSLSHYRTSFFTGNHCANYVQDFNETGIDIGGNCPIPAQISSPVPGSTLASSSATFQWNATSHPGYILVIGTAVAYGDIYSSGLLPAGTTSRTAINLPTNGSTLYVRLYSQNVGGTWTYKDYTYKASLAPAEISIPTPGSTLSSSSATFQWNNSGAPQYWLYVGTSLGSGDLYNSNPLPAGTTSRTVTNLPTNGSTLYVRLWTQRPDGSWMYKDYTYKAQWIQVDTGYKYPTANAADSGGDGNGYEGSATNAYAVDGLFATDSNSGNTSSTTWTDPGKDRHRYYNFGMSIPTGSSIRGMELQLKAKVSSTSSSPKIYAQISWDGGTSWTTVLRSTSTLSTTNSVYTLGSLADTWGRSWAAGDFDNTKFRVRLIDVAGSTSRTFSLDSVAVRVYY